MRYGRCRDADSGIADFQQYVTVAFVREQSDRPTARRKSDGIVEQIDDHLLQSTAVAADDGSTQGRKFKLNATILGHQPHLLCRTRGELRQIHIHPFALRVSGIQSRERKQPGNQVFKTSHFLEHAANALANLALNCSSTNNLLQFAFYHSERGAKLMRGIGEE